FTSNIRADASSATTKPRQIRRGKRLVEKRRIDNLGLRQMSPTHPNFNPSPRSWCKRSPFDAVFPPYPDTTRAIKRVPGSICGGRSFECGNANIQNLVID